MDAVLALAMSAEFARVVDVNLEEAIDILESTDSGETFKVGRAEYVFYSDSEADDACRDSILDSLCYFRAEFLDVHADIGVEAIQAIAEKEDSAAMRRLLERLGVLDDVINDAIRSDGRGHFLSHYDSEEIEIPGSNYFLYRVG